MTFGTTLVHKNPYLKFWREEYLDLMVSFFVIYVSGFIFVKLLVRQQRQIRTVGCLIRGMHFFDTSGEYFERCSVRLSRLTYNSERNI